MNIPRYTSIVIASYIPDEIRAKMFRTSLDSLLETTKDLAVEIIIVDNGGDISISRYIDGLLLDGAVQCVIHNANNLHFGFARNQGIAMAQGNYICIADNDIFYKKGWLESCWQILEKYPDLKIYATPICYPGGTNGRKTMRYNMGKLDDYDLDMRAGSNCFVIRKKDFAEIGLFKYHRVAGTKWTDEAVHKGYLAAVCPGELALHIALRAGYNHRATLPIKRTLRNGDEVYFNVDEYKI